MNIQLTESRQEKNKNTKTTYLKPVVTVSTITETQYNNYINGIKFFKRLGGSETLTKAYTCLGYKVVKLVSKSPDRLTKVVREFNFLNN